MPGMRAVDVTTAAARAIQQTMNALLNDLTDASLLAASDRDPDAFRELYGRYAERIHGYFRRRTGDARRRST